MSAVKHWKSQRLSAVALIPLTLWLLFSVASLASSDYVAVHHWLTQPTTTALLGLFIIIAGHHAFLGVQVILEDYVQNPLRHTATIAARLLLLITTALSIYAIYQITLPTTG